CARSAYYGNFDYW
nr:immunoglobulin heavy chain junction region [Mus musculus]